MSAEVKLREKIERAQSVTDLAHLEVELAIYLVRSGNFDEAQATYQKYHESPLFGNDTELSLNLMLLEGLSSFYRDQDFEVSADRLNRALRMGLAARMNSVSSRLSAWIGHVYFNACNFEAMSAALKQGMLLASEKDVDTLIRISLTLGDAFSSVGNFRLAREWYAYSRSQANTIEDRTSVAAIMHNRATMALAHCRFSQVCLDSVPSEASEYLIEVNSAASFENYIGLKIVHYPYEIWLGRMKMLEGKFFDARGILTSCIENNHHVPESAMLPAVLCDLAYCTFMTDDIAGAVLLMDQAQKCDLKKLYSDDLAVLYTYSAAIAENIGDSDRKRDFLLCANKAKSAALDEILNLKTELTNVLKFRPSLKNWPVSIC